MGWITATLASGPARKALSGTGVKVKAKPGNHLTRSAIRFDPSALPGPVRRHLVHNYGMDLFVPMMP